MSEALEAGVVASLTDGIRRLIAPNPGMMTGPGTNTYLLGEAELAVIDPGPAIVGHVERIVGAAAGAPIRWILATHTHPDHSPATAALAAKTGARVLGLPAPRGPHQDDGFRPDRVPQDGDTLEVGGITLDILHTPGHASNHLCFLHRQNRWLFTGDHVINGSTVVIDPPDGDMSAYLASLGRLRELSLAVIAGGHGAPIQRPYEAIDGLIDHRLRREAKVVDRLAALDGGTLAELVVRVYDEVDPRLHPIAERSLLAHLLKLERDGLARQSGGRWSLT